MGKIVQEAPREIKKEELLVEMEKFLTYEKRYSKTNIKSIMDRLNRIFYHYNILNPSMDDAIAIEEDLKQQERQGPTIRHYLRALELISEYRGIPLTLKKPKMVQKVPEMLSLPECRALVNGTVNLRDRAIITLVLYTGLRNNELINLHVQDVDLKSRIIYVRDHGQGIKKNRERKVVMGQECVQAIREWMKIRPELDSKELFINCYGNALSRSRPTRIVKEAAMRTGIDKNVYLHLLRHTCASMMLRSGIPITEVGLQLGHKSLNSTMIYLHADIEGLKEDIDKKFRY
jgi:site-specific recombinase XerD